MIVVVMGVSGSGKTTIGTRLARLLRCPYLEGDLLHPPENVEKMSHGIPLTDADREPWLEAVHSVLLSARRENRDLVAGCSALKESYRTYLDHDVPVRWVYLTGDPELIRSRLAARRGHFMDPHLFESQLADLDVPTDALEVDVADPPDLIASRIFRELTLAPEVVISPDENASFGAAASFLVSFIRETVKAKGRCLLALSGGDTPRGLYRLLADVDRYPIPWEGVHVFWCDERYVPADDPRSNYRMARETLLDHVPCPPANIHPMPTSHREPALAAAAYAELLGEYLQPDGSGFDLVLLGLGADCHTASLFPGSAAARENRAWVSAVTAPADPPVRLTLTLPVLNRSACAAFLVTGSRKSAAVASVLEGPPTSDDRAPAGAIVRSDARVVWWIDRDAASDLHVSGAAR